MNFTFQNWFLKRISFLLFFSVYILTNAQELSKYEDFIKTNFSGFQNHFNYEDLDKFQKISSNKLFRDYKEYNIQEIPTENIYYNPLKTKAINLNTDGDIDQDIDLIFLKQKKSFRVDSCGSSCRFKNGKWFNNNIVILIGNNYYIPEESFIDNNNIYPIIQIIDLNKNTKTIYIDYLNYSLEQYTKSLEDVFN